MLVQTRPYACMFVCMSAHSYCRISPSVPQFCAKVYISFDDPCVTPKSTPMLNVPRTSLTIVKTVSMTRRWQEYRIRSFSFTQSQNNNQIGPQFAGRMPSTYHYCGELFQNNSVALMMRLYFLLCLSIWH